MSYANAEGMVARFGLDEVVQLTDRAMPPTGEVDADVLEQALTDGADEIDAYLGARYALPLASAPPLLARLECDIARYRLASNAGVLTEVVEDRYNNAIKLLDRISKGTATLGLDVAETPVAVGAPLLAIDPPIFSRDTLRDF
jgi:phage gp36-like protein